VVGSKGCFLQVVDIDHSTKVDMVGKVKAHQERKNHHNEIQVLEVEQMKLQKAAGKQRVWVAVTAYIQNQDRVGSFQSYSYGEEVDRTNIQKEEVPNNNQEGAEYLGDWVDDFPWEKSVHCHDCRALVVVAHISVSLQPGRNPNLDHILNQQWVRLIPNCWFQC
jgi:hypothetical protein